MDIIEAIMVQFGVEEGHANNIFLDCRVYIDNKECGSAEAIVKEGQKVSVEFRVR